MATPTEQVLEIVRELARLGGGNINTVEVVRRAEPLGISEDEVQDALLQLEYRRRINRAPEITGGSFPPLFHAGYLG